MCAPPFGRRGGRRNAERRAQDGCAPPCGSGDSPALRVQGLALLKQMNTIVDQEGNTECVAALLGVGANVRAVNARGQVNIDFICIVLEKWGFKKDKTLFSMPCTWLPSPRALRH